MLWYCLKCSVAVSVVITCFVSLQATLLHLGPSQGIVIDMFCAMVLQGEENAEAAAEVAEIFQLVSL